MDMLQMLSWHIRGSRFMGRREIPARLFACHVTVRWERAAMLPPVERGTAPKGCRPASTQKSALALTMKLRGASHWLWDVLSGASASIKVRLLVRLNTLSCSFRRLRYGVGREVKV